ncbi:hypothetical protein CHUAL_001123 [Chamberlinius hualienensis]
MADVSVDNLTFKESFLSKEENDGLEEIRNWVGNDCEFYGRTDDEFLLIFLRLYKCNVEKVKRNITIYYQNRRIIPQWFAIRDLTDEIFLKRLNQKMNFGLIESDMTKPTVVFTIMERFGPRSNVNEHMKLHGIIAEVFGRRTTSQLNGLVWIIDCQNFPRWLITLFSPIFIRNVFRGFKSLSCSISSIHVINSPTVSMGVWTIVKAFLSKKISDRVFFYGNEWPTLYEKVSIEMIPNEYGGTGGPIDTHAEAFSQEILSYTDYFSDDNKYGY